MRFSVLTAVATGTAILALVGYVEAFPGHGGHHHGSAAMSACMAAAPKSVKTSLWSTFKSSPLHADRKAEWQAKQALAQAILANPKGDLTQLETNLSNAQKAVLHDQDTIAQTVCGGLSPAQLSAASTLYANLQSNRQTVHGYFQAARAAAGGTAGTAGTATE